MAYTSRPSGPLEGVSSALDQWIGAQPQMQQTQLIAEAQHRKGMANYLSQMESLNMIKNDIIEGPDGEVSLGYQKSDDFFRKGPRFDRLRAELINGSPVKNILKWVNKDGTIKDQAFEGYTYMGPDKGWVINTIRDDGKPAQLTEGATDDEVNDPNLIQMTDNDINETFQSALDLYADAARPGYTQENEMNKVALGFKTDQQALQAIEDKNKLIANLTKEDATPQELRASFQEYLGEKSAERGRFEEKFSIWDEDYLDKVFTTEMPKEDRDAILAAVEADDMETVDKIMAEYEEAPATDATDVTTGPEKEEDPSNIGGMSLAWLDPGLDKMASNRQKRKINYFPKKVKGIKNSWKYENALSTIDEFQGKTDLTDLNQRALDRAIEYKQGKDDEIGSLMQEQQDMIAEVRGSKGMPPTETGPDGKVVDTPYTVAMEFTPLDFEKWEKQTGVLASDLKRIRMERTQKWLKEEGVDSYEELVTNKQISMSKKKRIMSSLAFQLGQQLVQNMGPQAGVAVDTLQKSAYIAMYNDIVNGAPDLKTKDVQDYAIKLLKYEQDAQKFQFQIDEAIAQKLAIGDKIWADGMKGLFEDGNFLDPSQSEEFKIAVGQYALQIERLKKKNPATFTEVDWAIIDNYQNLIQWGGLSYGLTRHDSWFGSGKGFPHWFKDIWWWVDETHGAKNLFGGSIDELMSPNYDQYGNPIGLKFHLGPGPDETIDITGKRQMRQVYGDKSKVQDTLAWLYNNAEVRKAREARR